MDIGLNYLSEARCQGLLVFRPGPTVVPSVPPAQGPRNLGPQNFYGRIYIIINLVGNTMKRDLVYWLVLVGSSSRFCVQIPTLSLYNFNAAADNGPKRSCLDRPAVKFYVSLMYSCFLFSTFPSFVPMGACN